ncbi:hypothetical protein EJ06DRAFT_546892 [Trichodelitschia bisporula]|uniref:Calcofluor white hypersensitive protein n=1 Tax=Trichodelitschia bisporula TaxID=703511 RepID=A0A6G1I6R7_9PEZI|nr:hypothetical protein EJ06DRAFT_546892 [Trichodelitschia bisporula]
MSGRVVKVAGGVAAAGAAYYLYQAGGNPKVAEKQVEHDAAKLSSRFKSDLPGAGKEAKTGIKLSAEEAGQKVDDWAASAKQTTRSTDAKLEGYRAGAEKKIDEYRKEVGKDLSSAVDKFDKTVEEKAAASKSWLGSWFGGK